MRSYPLCIISIPSMTFLPGQAKEIYPILSLHSCLVPRRAGLLTRLLEQDCSPGDV